ncbi:MAG: DUF1569 domain-containing protein [Gemmatimonadota bacterium]
MPTLLNAADRTAIIARLHRLTPTLGRHWGKMTSAETVCHLSDQLRVALGDIAARPVDRLLTRTLLKWIVVYAPVRPPPGKIQTAPEMLSSKPTRWDEDLASCERLIERMGSETPAARNPFFGPMSPSQWGRLGWKHLDHHLRQFGV